nr:nucleotide pyrophosphohydrolase [Rhodoferax sp.]
MISSKDSGEEGISASKKPDLGISEVNPLPPLVDALRAFAHARDWEQFHTPKNLACALSVEASELLEHFQWLTDAQSQSLAPDKQQEVAAEAADVFLYLLQLCDKLDIDLIAAAKAKMLVNAQKYPVATARGNSAKYTEL